MLQRKTCITEGESNNAYGNLWQVKHVYLPAKLGVWGLRSFGECNKIQAKITIKMIKFWAKPI